MTRDNLHERDNSKGAYTRDGQRRLASRFSLMCVRMSNGLTGYMNTG